MYDAAVRDPYLLALEHAFLIAIGLLFWWPVLCDVPRAVATLTRIGYVFAAFVLSAFLGLALTFSPPVYDYYESLPERLWGIGAQKDQNLGGILMSTEQALVFFAAIVWLLVRLFREEAEAEEQLAGAARRGLRALTASGRAPAARSTRHQRGEAATRARPRARPGTIAPRLPRVQERRRDDELRPREVVELGRDGADALPERVAGGVPAHRPVALERVERAHAEQLEVVERLEVGAVDHGGPLRLEPERDARAREERAVVPDERDVRGAPHADEPRRAARLADAGEDRVEHVGVRQPVDRLANAVGERRPERDDHLGRVRPRRRDVAVPGERRRCRPRRRRAPADRRRAEGPAAAPSARPRAGTPSRARGTRSGRSPPSGRARPAR